MGIHGGYRQVVKTSDCGSDMHGFESHHPPHFLERPYMGLFYCKHWITEFEQFFKNMLTSNGIRTYSLKFLQ